MVHPAHAARLCGAYIRALRSKEDAHFEVRVRAEWNTRSANTVSKPPPSTPDNTWQQQTRLIFIDLLIYCVRTIIPTEQTQFTLGFLRRLAMHDHLVALNYPRLIPSGVHRKTERDMAVSSSALVNSGVSTRPYSMPSGGYGTGLGLSGSALRPRVGSVEYDPAAGTDSLEPHWLLELCIQVCNVALVLRAHGYVSVLEVVYSSLGGPGCALFSLVDIAIAK